MLTPANGQAVVDIASQWKARSILTQLPPVKVMERNFTRLYLPSCALIQCTSSSEVSRSQIQQVSRCMRSLAFKRWLTSKKLVLSSISGLMLATGRRRYDSQDIGCRPLALHGAGDPAFPVRIPYHLPRLISFVY